MAQHVVSAAFVKVSIGSPSGNRVAALLRRDDLIPEGVSEDQLKRLVDRGLIEEIPVEADEPAEVTLGEPDASEGDAKTKADKVAATAAAKK